MRADPGVPSTRLPGYSDHRACILVLFFYDPHVTASLSLTKGESVCNLYRVILDSDEVSAAMFLDVLDPRSETCIQILNLLMAGSPTWGRCLCLSV